MKMKMIYKFIIASFFFSINSAAQEEPKVNKIPELGSKEFLKNQIISRLDPLLTTLEMNRGQLSIDDIKKLLKEHKESFHGTVHDVDKFFTLKDLCAIIENHPEKSKLTQLLFEELGTLEAWDIKKPLNWNEYLPYSADGSVGLLVVTYLKISELKDVGKLYKLFLEKDDHLKVEIFLKKIRMYDFGDRYWDMLKTEQAAYEVKKSPSEKVINVTTTQMQEMKKYIEKKAKKKAEQ